MQNERGLEPDRWTRWIRSGPCFNFNHSADNSPPLPDLSVVLVQSRTADELGADLPNTVRPKDYPDCLQYDEKVEQEATMSNVIEVVFQLSFGI